MGERIRELVILVFGDAIFFISALWLTLSVRYLELPSDGTIDAHLGPFLILSLIWLLVYYIAGLYDKQTTFLKSLLFSRIISTQALNIAIAGVIFFIIPLGITPKTNLVIYLFISSGLLVWWRLKLFPLLTPKKRYQALLIADGDEAEELVAEVNNGGRYNFSFVKVLKSEIVGEGFADRVRETLKREKINLIVANPGHQQLAGLLPTLFDLTFIKSKFIFLDFYKVYEDTFDRIPLSSLGYDWFLQHISHSKGIGYEFVKRLIDVVGGICLLIVLALTLPLVALAIRLEGRGKIFIDQKRVGRFNQPITVYKIRTMTENNSASATWMKEDKEQGNRVTRVGAVLRKLSLDEFPQCLNILRGEMSLIGPRSDIEGLAHRLAEEIPYYNIRNFIKSGLTGWAQTNQHYAPGNISPQSIAESKVRLAYDLYYVKNRSLWLDLSIALRTIKTLLVRAILAFKEIFKG